MVEIIHDDSHRFRAQSLGDGYIYKTKEQGFPLMTVGCLGYAIKAKIKFKLLRCKQDADVV